MTTTVSIGFFALPAQHLEEIVQLDNRSRDAVYHLKDDSSVRDNELYRRAAAVALHHAELSGEREETFGAFAALSGFMCDKAWRGVDQSLFAPEEAQALASTIAELERRARSRTKLVQRIARHRGRREAPELCRRVYDAFRETLDAATSQDAGFLWAAYWPDAEAELAERQAREEERARKRAASEAEWQRLSPEERAAIHARNQEELAKAQAELEDLIEERQLMQLDRQWAEREDIHHAWLCLLPAAERAPLRALLDAHHQAGSYDEARRLFAQARAHIEDHALEIVVLPKHGAFRTLEALDRRLRQDCPAAHDPHGLYAPDQARALLEALDRRRALRGGLDGVVAEIARETWMPEPLIAAAYRALQRALEQAATRPCALFWLRDDPYDVFLDPPATPAP